MDLKDQIPSTSRTFIEDIPSLTVRIVSRAPAKVLKQCGLESVLQLQSSHDERLKRYVILESCCDITGSDPI